MLGKRFVRNEEVGGSRQEKPDSSRTRPDLLFRLLGLRLKDEEVDAHPHQHTPSEHEDMPYEVRDGFSS